MRFRGRGMSGAGLRIVLLLFPVVRYCVGYYEGAPITDTRMKNVLLITEPKLELAIFRHRAGFIIVQSISLFGRLNEPMTSDKPSERAPCDSHPLLI